MNEDREWDKACDWLLALVTAIAVVSLVMALVVCALGATK